MVGLLPLRVKRGRPGHSQLVSIEKKKKKKKNTWVRHFRKSGTGWFGKLQLLLKLWPDLGGRHGGRGDILLITCHQNGDLVLDDLLVGEDIVEIPSLLGGWQK